MKRMKAETKFRTSKVIPFLKTLPNTWFEPIQQVAINGSPDFVLGCAGKLVLLELKADNGKLSELQKFKLQDAMAKGSIALVASPKNWEWIKARLTQLDKGE